MQRLRALDAYLESPETGVCVDGGSLGVRHRPDVAELAVVARQHDQQVLQWPNNTSQS